MFVNLSFYSFYLHMAKKKKNPAHKHQTNEYTLKTCLQFIFESYIFNV